MPKIVNDGDARKRPDGLVTRMRVTPSQNRLIEKALDVPAKYPAAMRRVFVHVLYCQLTYGHRYLERGVPLPWYKIADLDGAPMRGTEAVWRPITRTKLLRDFGFGVGVCRRFLVSPYFVQQLVEAGQADEAKGTKGRINAVTGVRDRSVYKTRLTDDEGRSWKGRSTLIYQVLQYWKQGRGLVNVPAFKAYLEGFRERVEKAERAAQLMPMSKRGRRRAEHLRARYAQEERCWKVIEEQRLRPAEDMPEGIYQYDPAYEPQTISGRLSMIAGGLQNMSSDGKAAAYQGIPGLRNYDIKSSQTIKLEQLFREAITEGADLDITVLTDYPGKDKLAADYGVSREVFKRAEHAPKFGAGFHNKTFKAARAAAEGRAKRHHKHRCGRTFEQHVRAEMHTMPKIALEIAEDPAITEINDPEQAYEILQNVYGKIATEVKKWRDWLVEHHWTLHNQPGGDGRFVENPCGLAFNMHAYDERERGAKYATTLLQGGEAVFIHHLTLLGQKYGYEVVANEHDGLVTLGEIPQKAIKEARKLANFPDAELIEKPFTEQTTTPCASTPMTVATAMLSTASSVPTVSSSRPATAKTGSGSSAGTKTQSSPCGAKSSPTSPYSSTRTSSMSSNAAASPGFTPTSPSGTKAATKTSARPSMRSGAPTTSPTSLDDKLLEAFAIGGHDAMIEAWAWG